MLFDAIKKDYDQFAQNIYRDIVANMFEETDRFTKVFFGEALITENYKQGYTFEQFKVECASELRQAYAEARIAETRNLINLALGLIRK